MDIYLDVMFFINFVMDYIVLYLSGMILKKKISVKWRTLICAAAAIVGILFFVFPIPTVLAVLFRLFIPMLMAIAAFGRCGASELVKRYITLIGIQFLTSGIMNDTLNFAGPNVDVLEKNGTVYFCFPDGLFITAFVLTYGISKLFCIFLSHRKRIYSLALTKGECTQKVNALYDSGNCLCDPVTKKPVIIAERSVLSDMNCLNDSGRIFLPFTTVGQNNTLMEVITLDSITFIKENRKLEHILVGISDAPLSTSGKLQVLLHRDLYI